MADNKEQAKPLAPAALRFSTDEDDVISLELKKHQSHRKCIQWCGCITAILLILCVIMLVLIFTVFRVKDPIIRMNSVTVEGISALSRSNGVQPGANLTIVADVSVKNPNAASFKYNDATTYLYYDSSLIGEARTSPGHARARRTLRTNVTIDVMLDKILAAPRFPSDLRSGILPVSSYTRIGGKVKILKMIKKHVVVKLNCTMKVDTRSQSILDQDCRRHQSV